LIFRSSRFNLSHHRDTTNHSETHADSEAGIRRVQHGLIFAKCA
jgi:hypothetical protein